MYTKLSKCMGVFVLMLASTLAWAQNPIADFYRSEGYPSWTNEIKWSNKIDMSTYTNGATEFERFENARDQLYNQGGWGALLPCWNLHL